MFYWNEDAICLWHYTTKQERISVPYNLAEFDATGVPLCHATFNEIWKEVTECEKGSQLAVTLQPLPFCLSLFPEDKVKIHWGREGWDYRPCAKLGWRENWKEQSYLTALLRAVAMLALDVPPPGLCIYGKYIAFQFSTCKSSFYYCMTNVIWTESFISVCSK